METPPVADALALIELYSVARGLRALDLLVKKAPVEVIEGNLVEPGKFLLLFAGDVASVQESHQEVMEYGQAGVIDQLLLPFAHPHLLRGLRGHEEARTAEGYDCLGVIEGKAVASTLHAADRSLKEADITLAGIRVTGGLGGRSYYVVFGYQHDVEVAIEAGRDVLTAANTLHHCELIPRPHEDMVGWLLRPAPFGVGRA